MKYIFLIYFPINSKHPIMDTSHFYAQVPPPTDEEIKQVLDHVNHFRKNKDFENAERLVCEGIKYLKQFNNINNNSHFTVYLAKILFEQKKYAEAEPVCREALILLEMRYGLFRAHYEILSPGAYNDDVVSKYILNSMNMYALVLNEVGKFDEAEHLFREILKIKEHIFKPKQSGAINESTLRSIVRLACMLHNRKKYYEAADYLQSAFRWMRKMYGTCDKETMQINNYLCDSLRKLERFEDVDYWFDQGSPNEEIPMFPFRN